VGDLPLVLQPKLLRVLLEQQLERLGMSREHEIRITLHIPLFARKRPRQMAHKVTRRSGPHLWCHR
jgi:transcriptional regulator with GAF, ATPase, and Fis domain